MPEAISPALAVMSPTVKGLLWANRDDDAVNAVTSAQAASLVFMELLPV